MSAATVTGPGEDLPRLCHGLVLRLPDGVDSDRLSTALAVVAPGVQLGYQEPAFGHEDERAARLRENQLSQPVDPGAGPGLRVALLRYRDGVAELSLIGHRAAFPDLPAVAHALLVTPVRVAPAAGESARLRAGLARLDRLPPPLWGLGEPDSPGTSRAKFTLPAPAYRPARVVLAAALGLALARYSDTADVALGMDLSRDATFAVDHTLTVADYLDRVDRALGAPAPGQSAVAGLLLPGPPPPGTVIQSLPALAPVHPLTVYLTEEGTNDELSGCCQYRREVFADAVVHWLLALLDTAYRNLALASARTPVGEIDLLSLAQQRELAELGGLGRAPAAGAVPSEHRIEQVVRGWARRTPDATAVCFERGSLSYRQLDERADQAARALRTRGIGPGDRVGVCLPRSLDLVVMLLAVLKSGAAYVPLDPAYPADRLAYTARDAGVSLVISDAPRFATPPETHAVAPGDLTSGDRSSGPPELPDDPGAAAYVIYTSGSTGRPKGVMVGHRNVLGLLAATSEEFEFTGCDVWTMFHSSAFDFSVWEIWGCLMTGGRLVVVPYWVSRDPERFAALLDAERVTVLNQTPSAFAQLMTADQHRPLACPPRLVIFGGEPLDTRPLGRWLDNHPEQHCRLVNMFGITETTVHVTAQSVSRHEVSTGSRSVGRPLPGWHIYLRDAAGRALPPGAVGEIFVGGVGVAGSYLNRPELTGQRFPPDPSHAGRMYRSGDQGRLLPDGRLEHLGRLDNQVKLRGFRIELDEIRTCLLDVPPVVAAAVVLHRSAGDAAEDRLDGYIVLRAETGDADAAVAEVREHLARFLPEHMVPATITPLPALPLTANGKVDLARLPEPRPPGTVAGPEAAGEDTESRLAAVWETVFGFRVGPDDDFFALGGNSLLGVRLLAAIQSAGLSAPPLPQLYRNRTVRTLSAMLDSADDNTV